MRTNLHAAFVFTLATATLATAACRQDPAAAAQRFVASGDTHVAARQFEAAVLEYRNALEHQPQAAHIYYELGLAYEQLQQAGNAEAAFVKVTEFDDTHTDAHMRVSERLIESARFDEAEQLANRVLAREPRHVRALSIAADALDGMGRSAASKKRIDRALEIDPRSSVALVSLASWQLRSGDIVAAGRTLRRAVDFNPQSVEAWTALATTEWRLGDIGQAETALRRVLVLSPHRTEAQRLLASFLVQTDRAASAEPYLRELAETSSADRLALADYYLAQSKREVGVPLLQSLTADKDKNIAAQAHLRQAMVARSDRNSRQAHLEIDRAMQQRLAQPQAHLLKAQLLLDEGNLDDALKHAQKATTLQPQWGDGSYALATVHLARGELSDAEREFKRARDLVNPPALVDLQLARLALDRDDANTAVTLARQVVAAMPSATTHALLARALRANGDVGEGLKVVASASKRWKHDVELETELGYLELAARRPARARAAFERALTTSPTSIANRSGLVVSYVIDHRLEAARTSLDSWRSGAPDDVPLAILSAQVDIAEGQTTRAEQTLLAVVRRAPRNPDAAETLAQLYISSGSRDRAVEYLRRVVELRPKPVAALTAIGMLKQEAGDRIGAIDMYQRAIAVNPVAGVAANNLAWLYAEDNRLDDASRMAQQAVRSLPDASQPLHTLGWVSYRQKRFDVAIKYLSQAVEQAPENQSYRDHLALARRARTNSLQ